MFLYKKCVFSILLYMYHPVKVHKLSAHQHKRLMKGEGVTIKHGSHHVLHLDKEQLKKFERNHRLGKGMVLHMHPHQIAHHGGGFEDLARDTGAYLRPVADAGMARAIREIGSGMAVRKHKRVHKMRGKGMWDWADPAKNGSQQFFEHDLPSNLIHQGIPSVTGSIGGLGGAYFGGPVGGVAGSYAGSEAGRALADEIGRQTGYGLMGDAFSMAKSHGKRLARSALSKAHAKAKEMAGHYLDMGASKAHELIGEGAMSGRVKKGGAVRKHRMHGRALLVA
jgi:hypothetical protein